MDKFDAETGYKLEQRFKITESDYYVEQEGGLITITNGQEYDCEKTVDLNEAESLAVLKILARLHGFDLVKKG